MPIRKTQYSWILLKALDNCAIKHILVIHVRGMQRDLGLPSQK